jgi:AmmeMemoRadiSam system protein B
MDSIRPAAVAGQFYPANSQHLSAMIEEMLAAAPSAEHEAGPPKAIITPHAGYIYSGPFAAAIYARLRPWRERIKRVALFGPAHREYVEGMAVPSADYFATPLGKVAIDHRTLAALADGSTVVVDDRVHAYEHALEVQLPFLQTVLDEFTLLPIAVGGASARKTAAVMAALWGGAETLIVVSSDLSHYLPASVARRRDGDTAGHILRLAPDLDGHDACGATPINALLQLAKRHHLHASQIALGNSGDTAGDSDRVVGYGAFAFSEETTHAQ